MCSMQHCCSSTPVQDTLHVEPASVHVLNGLKAVFAEIWQRPFLVITPPYIIQIQLITIQQPKAWSTTAAASTS